MNNKNYYLEQHFYEKAAVNPDKYNVTEMLTVKTNIIQPQLEKDEKSPGFNHCKAASLTDFALHS